MAAATSSAVSRQRAITQAGGEAVSRRADIAQRERLHGAGRYRLICSAA
jgi:hypothetical protein